MADDLEFKPANPFNLAAKMNSGSSPTQQEPQATPQNPVQPQQGAQEQQPYTYGTYTQQVNAQKGDYFSHDNKAYYRRDGKTYLLTGDPMGDVELDVDQSAKLDKDLADKAAREKAKKEGPIYTDQAPGGEVDRNEPQPDYNGLLKKMHPAEEFAQLGKDIYAGYTNEGKPSDAEMWNAPAGRKIGRIVDQRAWTLGGEGTADLINVGSKLANGEPLSDAEKWQALYHPARVAAQWVPISKLGAALGKYGPQLMKHFPKP